MPLGTVKSFTHLPRRTFPGIERKSGINGRYYQVNGKRYPSVTRVVSTFAGSYKEKAWLDKLRREGKDPDKISRDNMALGTKFHAACESYLKNSVRDKPLECLKMIDGLKPHLDRIDNIRALETYLYSATWKLAGTVDCIAEFDGRLTVIDFKTTTRLKEKWEVPDYFAQCAAYSFMWEELTGERATDLAVLMVDRTGNARVLTDKRYSAEWRLLSRVILWREKNSPEGRGK